MHILNLIKRIFNLNQTQFILIVLFLQFFTPQGVKFYDRDCYLYNKNDKYDLLRPSGETWQKINFDTVQFGSASLDFSLCRRKNQDRCSGRSDLCLINSNALQIDHFADLNDIKFEPNTLVFTFLSNEKSCNNKTLNITIRMVCSEFDYSPDLQHSEEMCDLTIKWINKNACPVKEEISNKCFISSKHGMYDLRPLENYDLTSKVYNGRKIHLNLCGSLDSCQKNVAVAYINPNRKCDAKASIYDKKLFLSSSRGLTMIFNQTHSNNKIVINFKCVDKIVPKLVFEDENEGSLYFILETMLACHRQKSTCLWESGSKKIDLSPLRKVDNWIVRNNKETLIFNICSSLNYKQDFLCSGVISACVKKSDGNFINYGTHFDIKMKEKAFTMSSIGEKCENRNYTLNITFIPTNFPNEKHPKIVHETSCSKHLEWSTPYAIPIDYFKAKDCEIITSKEHYRNQDFKKLFEIKDYRIDVHNGSFRINLCSNLREKCGQVSDVSVCYTDENGLDHPIGMHYEPYLRAGSSEFRLQGLSCSDDFLYSEVHFQMSCTYSEEKLQFLHKIGCKFMFKWKTKEACLYLDEEKDSEETCRISDESGSYDLSPLKNYSDNYHIDITNNSKLLINICRPLVPQPSLYDYDSGCPLVSEACLINTTSSITNKKNIGIQPSTLEIVAKNHLRLKYNSPVNCYNPEGNTSTIDFFCSEKESGPQFVGYDGKCFYHLKWYTKYACPISNSKPEPPCLITDPYSHRIVNLTSLMHTTHEIEGYYVSICTPIGNSLCNQNTSVCQISSNTSYGDFTNKISILDNSVLLNYTTSDCKTTLIYFVCAQKEKIPVKIHKKNCTNIMYWYTPHACLYEPINCTFADSSVHKIDVEKGTVVLKACSQLVPDFEECPGGSSSCLILNNSSLSIGYPLSEPSYQDDGSVVLATNGDFCDNLKGLRYSTIIHFVCNASESNEGPYFQKLTHNCQYHFVWPTASLCKKIKPVHKCDHIASNLRKKLNELYTNDIHEVVVKDVLHISVCDIKPMCDSDVCIKRKNAWLPFGELSFDNIAVTSNKTTILYKTDKTTDISCFGRVNVNCQTTTGKGSPQITWMEPDCGFEVVWNTSLICPSPHVFESSSSWLSSFFLFVTVLSVLFAVLVYLKRKNNLNFFQRIYPRRLINEESSSINLFQNRIEINETNGNLQMDESLSSYDERWSWAV